jgi:hypothetical protein
MDLDKEVVLRFRSKQFLFQNSTKSNLKHTSSIVLGGDIAFIQYGGGACRFYLLTTDATLRNTIATLKKHLKRSMTGQRRTWEGLK